MLLGSCLRRYMEFCITYLVIIHIYGLSIYTAKYHHNLNWYSAYVFIGTVLALLILLCHIFQSGPDSNYNTWFNTHDFSDSISCIVTAHIQSNSLLCSYKLVLNWQFSISFCFQSPIATFLRVAQYQACIVSMRDICWSAILLLLNIGGY